jgi:hypothetical protein
MKMVNAQRFPIAFRYTKNNNNNIKILDISFILYERAIDIFYIYCYYFNTIFNFDNTGGILLSKNYKRYETL